MAKNIIWSGLFLFALVRRNAIVTHHNIKDNVQKMMVIAVVFLLLVLQSLYSQIHHLYAGHSFSAWFKETDIKSLVYDVIIMTTMYVVFHKLLAKFKYHNP